MGKNVRGRSVLSGVLICVLLMNGCAGLDSVGKNEGERFDEYTDNLFKEEIAENTINLHYTLAHPQNYDITDYEISLGNFAMEEFEENEKELREMKSELEGFKREKLSDEQKLTYDLLMDYVNAEIPAADLYLYNEYLSPVRGYQSNLPVLLAEYTFRREQDIEDYLALLSEVDDVFGDIITFEKEKAKAGLFMPDFAVDETIDQCEQFIEDPENNYMIEVFNDKIDDFEGLSEEEKEAYKEKNKELVTTEVVDGYQMLIDELEALKGSGENDCGLYYYDDGVKYYRYLIRTNVGSGASVEELQDRTFDYIVGNLQNIYTCLEDNPEVYDLWEDYSYPYTEPDEIMQDLIAKCEKDFPAPPQVDYTIKYVHPSMEEHESPAFYLTPPIDDIENNVIYINGKDADDEIYTMLAHEGYPGHLYQNVSTSAYGMPLVRNLFSYTGYSEGWATYVEMYSYGISGLDEDLADVLAWENGMYLGISAYIDMGVHYDGWELEDVEEFLSAFGIEDKDAAREIYELIVEEPSYYLTYFIGYLEFLNLRDMAMEEMGDDFVLKDFHEFIIQTGPAPFYIIEDRMEEWMKK
ncbi:MAG: DUF885 domain-containing protein [Lachnospiraceae bacterium]|nr:DUF885 domain-containing protein [Lachnospiraceae bacterium]